MNDYLDKVYEESFQNDYACLMLRKTTDPQFTKEYLDGLLQSLYIQQGNNWLGRSESKESALRAMIAACETIFMEWT